MVSLAPEPVFNNNVYFVTDYKDIIAAGPYYPALKEMTENYESRKVVERAKWILMERNNLNENEAYDRMRKKSMDSRMSMRSIAEAIIFTYEITNKSSDSK